MTTPSRRDFIAVTGAALAGLATRDAAQAPSPGRRLYADVAANRGDDSLAMTTFVADATTGMLTQGAQLRVERPGVIHFAAL